VLVQKEIDRLQDAVNTLTKRKTRKRRYIRAEETLTVSEVSDLIAEKEGGSRKDGETPAKRVRAERRCGRCSEIGHNSRTCKVKIEDVDNSNASEQYYPVTYSIGICCGAALRRAACAALEKVRRSLGCAARL
jgi:hypothetical protein